MNDNAASIVQHAEVRRLANFHPPAETALRTLVPEAFKPQTVDTSRVKTLYSEEYGTLIENRLAGEFKNRAFYLNPKFMWELKSDDFGQTVLVPTFKG